jgi:starch synthase
VKILFASSEAAPLIKTGGLADVSGSLPRSLRAQGDDVRLVLPAYPAALQAVERSVVVGELQVPGHLGSVRILSAEAPQLGVPLYLVDIPGLFDRPGNPYVDASGHDYADNALRFASFSRAVVALALGRIDHWRPEVVHCNDWQTGLVSALLTQEWDRPATVFTIHNLAYQGLFDRATFDALELPAALWSPEGLEFHDDFSLIKGGIAFADMVTTVSPTYAREICDPALGYGLDGLLRHRGDRLVGILNGIDTHAWDPATDPHLPAHYDADDLSGKTACKSALLKAFDLPAQPGGLLFSHIGRLVSQKGADLIISMLPSLMAAPNTQLVVLGSGDPQLEQALRDAAQRYPGRVAVKISYDEPLAHLVEAGSDVFLMPSRFEPCGLNQMYSLRYGTVPVVRNTGGLADTVVDASSRALFEESATGFVFEHADADGLWWAVNRAIELHRRPSVWWEKLMLSCMAQDFDWRVSAQRYRELYQFALDHPAAAPISKLRSTTP